MSRENENYLINLQSQIENMRQTLNVVDMAYNHYESIGGKLDILKYFPQSKKELFIQNFNLSGGSKLPSDLIKDDQIAMWILKNDTLDRSIVANFLTNPIFIQAEKILDSISMKVCSLEECQGFIEGLKIYLPVVGGILNPNSDNTLPLNLLLDQKKLRKLLLAYGKAHIKACKKCIIPTILSSNDNLTPKLSSLLADLSLEVLNLYQSLAIADRPLSVLMNGFFRCVRSISFRYEDEITSAMPQHNTNLKPQPTIITGNVMDDIFNAVSSNAALMPIPNPIGEDMSIPPSYLFSNITRSNHIRIEFHSNDESPIVMRGKLCNNVLYFTKDVPLTGDTLDKGDNEDNEVMNTQMLISCIPLALTRVRLSDNLGFHLCIELTPRERAIPYITFNCHRDPIYSSEKPFPPSSSSPINSKPKPISPLTNFWPAPDKISYFAKISLEILDDDASIGGAPPSESLLTISNDSDPDPRILKQQMKRRIDLTMTWLEDLENISWDC